MIKRSFDFRQDIADEICNLLISGQSLRTITKNEAMPSQGRVYQWLAENEDFQKHYAHARELQADAIFDECMDIADEANNDFKVNAEGAVQIDHDAINRARLRIDTRKWMAGKLRPKKYGDKLELDQKHSLSDPLMELLTDVASHGKKITDR